MNRGTVAALIGAHEGKRAAAYHDSRGILTVGIGCNLTEERAPARISSLGMDYVQLCDGQCELTDEHIAHLFSDDLDDAIATAQVCIKNFDEHPEDVQHAIIDMIFNLGGPRFSKFRKMIAALEAKDYRRAAAEMAESKWAEQVPQRAREDIELVLRHVEV